MSKNKSPTPLYNFKWKIPKTERQYVTLQNMCMTRPLHRYTVYRYTGQQASISEPVWPSLFIRYVFDKKHSKNARNLSFAVNCVIVVV